MEYSLVPGVHIADGECEGRGKAEPALTTCYKNSYDFCHCHSTQKRPQCYWHTRSTLSAAAPTLGDRQRGAGLGNNSSTPKSGPVFDILLVHLYVVRHDQALGIRTTIPTPAQIPWRGLRVGERNVLLFPCGLYGGVEGEEEDRCPFGGRLAKRPTPPSRPFQTFHKSSTFYGIMRTCTELI